MYTLNEVFVKRTGVFIDLLGENAWIRKKESLSWYFIFDTIELLIVAIGESNKKNIRKAMFHLSTIYQVNNYAFSMMYFNGMDEAEGANLVLATCQYLYNMFEKGSGNEKRPPLYLAFDNLELRHTVMNTITVLLRTIIKNRNIRNISFQNHYFGQSGFKMLSNCLASNERVSKAEEAGEAAANSIFTLDISKGKISWNGAGGLKNLIQSANIYNFESKDVSTKAIEITEYERKYTSVITMVYVLCFSTSVLTNWIMLRENTIMVDITFFYLPLIYIAACLNSIALKMLIYSTCVRCFRHDEINIMSHSILTYSFNLGIIAYLYYVDAYLSIKFWISIILLFSSWFSLRFMVILSKSF